MGVTRSKQSRKVLLLLLLVGLIGLPVAAVALFRRSNPQAVITRVMRNEGVDEKTIKQWIAISAFETAGWTSRVFRDSNNLFNLRVPGSVTLSYGEKQTVYGSLEDSVNGLFQHVLRPFSYPLNYSSIDSQVQAMKQRGFFTSGLQSYIDGVKLWYSKLYQ
jgi:hypothetical protein